MSNWPQYLTIGWMCVRFIILVGRDMEEPTPQKMWFGVAGSVLATVVPMWVLDMGGFFDVI